VNVGIIGAGNISETHALAARAAGLNVAAIFGDNHHKAKCLAARFDAVACDTLERLLHHPSLDLVMIGSPSGCHAQQATAAVRQGLHVLVEKPLDISTSRVDALLDEVARAKVTLGVFFQDRLKPDVVSLKHLVDTHQIGTPIIATGEVKWFRPPDYYATSRWRGTWALDGGGALMNQGIHTVDLLLYLLGPVVRVSGLTATRVHKIEAEDTALAILEFASGVVGTMEATTAAYPGQPRRLTIVGSAGSVTLEGDALTVIGPGFSPAASGAPPENASSPLVSDFSAHQRIIEDFVDAVRGRRPPICDGHEGRRSVEVVEAVYRSAREGVTASVVGEQ
jgi:UDP-N-acetyl-2-amino-2-deoxyglucuronate dehydrogenase